MVTVIARHRCVINRDGVVVVVVVAVSRGGGCIINAGGGVAGRGHGGRRSSM